MRLSGNITGSELKLKKVEVSSESGLELRKDSEFFREVTEVESDHCDVISQLKANMKSLEDLQGRMGFMLNEIKTLLVKRNS